ncbi:hypothetical protein BJY00DRAFT_312123 [Aspergillus carlsbadensis]|nr:hypothetical protein BJY00DRAFT_312123 [Aspergillus carlsbadensis]
MSTTARRGFLPREGLYIDPIVNALRRSILHPLFTVTLLHLVRTHTFASLGPYEKVLQITATATVLFWLNDWLSTKSANNWVADDSWDWKKELVVVTGGSGGIGAGVAQRLADMGARVVVLDIIPLTYSSETNRIVYHKCDLSDEKEIAAVCETIRSEVGDPTVLVNNAGLSRGRTIAEGTYADNSITLKTNLLAPFLLTKEFLPAMIRRNHGHIFNVASMSAYIPPPGLADYAASKAGLIAFHECLAQELRAQNAPKVRTSLAVLSFTKTPLFKGETNQSRFMMPLLHVDTVVDAIVDILDSGLGQTIFLPGIFRYFAGLRGAPGWVQDLVRGGTKSLKVDFKGRQEIDPQTAPFGYIVSEGPCDLHCPRPGFWNNRIPTGPLVFQDLEPFWYPASINQYMTVDSTSGYWFPYYGSASHRLCAPLPSASPTQATTLSYPCTSSEGSGNIAIADFDTNTSSSGQTDGQSTTSETETEPSSPINAASNPTRPLNWGSDTSFQPNNNYTRPADQLSENDTINRLLENSKCLIRHYQDLCATPRPSRHIIRGRPRGSLNKLPRKSIPRSESRSKAAHIRSEQVRRDLVNKGFEELEAVVPRLRGQRFSKSHTLRVVCDWIEELSLGNEALKAQLAELDRNLANHDSG